MRAEFRLLGDVEVRTGDRLVEIGHARQRAVLVALLADVNRVVTVDQLMARVWGERLPQRARGTLHSYLSRLRGVLPSEAALSRRQGGYVLDADPLTVDMHRFRHLLARAREHGTDDVPASRLFQEALGLWHGDEPFAGLDTPWFAALRDSLANERYAAELDLTDAGLRLGRHGELLSSLGERVLVHPLDERVAGQYVWALFRAGRRGDALAHLRQVRVRLVEELGVEPRPELLALQQRVLRGDEDQNEDGAASGRWPGSGAGSGTGTGPGPGADGGGGAGGGADEVRVSTLRVETVHVASLAVARAGDGAEDGPWGRGRAAPAQLPAAVPDFTGPRGAGGRSGCWRRSWPTSAVGSTSCDREIGR